ncbi:hypothetical protein [Rhizobium sp. ZX09]|uniref:hypothetical protein n=1 Tax=Rhizobium sp. ZX09 TaxID=2291939 RepID=UPI001A97EB4C|nr:hypothetical protein [Rhizobium sp. ZX09]
MSWSTFLNPLLPDFFRIYPVNRKLLKRMEVWQTHEAFADIRKLGDDDLKKYIESEWVRAKELDDKLSKLTATLSIALTVGGAVAKTVVDGLAPSTIKYIVLALLFVSMLFFLWGALVGFQGLRPKPRYGYGSKYLAIIAEGGADGRQAMENAACGFETVNLVRANEASLAIGLIRNGVFAFAIAMAVSFISPSKAQEPAPALPKFELVVVQSRIVGFEACNPRDDAS